MKKLEDFKSEKIQINKIFGKSGAFVHTGFRFWNGYVQDVYYDSDGSGTMNSDGEKKSFSLAQANV